MTPAARDNPIARKCVLARLMKGMNGRSAPIVVDIPAPMVSPNASTRLPSDGTSQTVGLGQDSSSMQVSFRIPSELLEHRERFILVLTSEGRVSYKSEMPEMFNVLRYVLQAEAGVLCTSVNRTDPRR